jgi:ABC-2 type transport system permease protein
MPRGTYLAAKMAMAMVFAAVVSLLLMVFAAVGAGVVLQLMRWALLLVLAVLGVIPFCAIGLLVGSVCKATAAPAVLNLIYLPMSFLSGLWVPLSLLPRPLVQLAPLWPSWHLAQIAQVVAGSGAGSGTAVHVLVLSAMAAACFTAAQRALARPR